MRRGDAQLRACCRQEFCGAVCVADGVSKLEADGEFDRVPAADTLPRIDAVSQSDTVVVGALDFVAEEVKDAGAEDEPEAVTMAVNDTGAEDELEAVGKEVKEAGTEEEPEAVTMAVSEAGSVGAPDAVTVAVTNDVDDFVEEGEDVIVFTEDNVNVIRDERVALCVEVAEHDVKSGAERPDVGQADVQLHKIGEPDPVGQ